jgi:translation initiation factor IF-3
VSKHFRGKAKNDLNSKYFVNNQIKSTKVFVITDTGENLGLISKQEALDRAQEAGLDLVQVGKKDNTPVTKIMDFGKFLYIKKKQMADAKKHQKTIQLKEIKMRPNIGDQDYKTKLKKAVEFFGSGKKVKFTLQFKGREITMISTLGKKIFNRITQDLKEQEVGTLVEEKDNRSGAYWSKVYFIKTK